MSERFETEQLPLETSCITVGEAQRQCDLNDECEAFSYSSLGAILYKPPTVKVSASNNVVSTTWEQRVTFAKKRLSNIFVKHKAKLPAGATSLGSLTGSLSSCENACGDGQCIGFTRPAGAMPSQEVACDLYGPFDMFEHKAGQSVWYSRETPSSFRSVESGLYMAVSAHTLGTELHQEITTAAVLVPGSGFVRLLFAEADQYVAVGPNGNVYTEREDQLSDKSKFIRSIEEQGTVFSTFDQSFLAMYDGQVYTTSAVGPSNRFDTALFAPPDADAPVVLDSSPFADEENISAGLRRITITFDKPITLGTSEGMIELIPHNRMYEPIVISAQDASRVRANNHVLTILSRTKSPSGRGYSKLGSQVRYSLQVPHGTVQDQTELQNPSATFSVDFTAEDSEPPLLVDTTPFANEVSTLSYDFSTYCATQVEVRLLTPITLEFNEAVQSGKGLVVIEPLGLNGTRYELTTATNQVKWPDKICSSC